MANSFDPTTVHESFIPLKWLIGRWKSVEGEVKFPTMEHPVKYVETLDICHSGNPVFNYRARSVHADTGKVLHQEEGFLLLNRQPSDHLTVALLLAHMNGMTDVSEGVVDSTAMRVELHSHMNKMQTASFMPESATQMKRVIHRIDEETLVQTVQMATPTIELTDHTKSVFKLVSTEERM